MCNHCPYVLHLLDKIIEISIEIKELGINTVGISSNDVENYPEDHPKLMKKVNEDRDFSFPYYMMKLNQQPFPMKRHALQIFSF